MLPSSSALEEATETEAPTLTSGPERSITRTSSDADEAQSSALSAGDHFERYHIRARLGAGGMGEVYAAHDPALDRDVALKLIRPRRRGVEDTSYTLVERERLLSEAQALARLSHPNVVQVYEARHHAGQTFLAMELVDGPTLRDWKPSSLAEVLRAYTDAARGLAAAHAAKLVHRDFKPSNVLLGSDGRVRVADFGLALRPAPEREVTMGDESESRPGTRSSSSVAGPGTLPYMAPEQAFFGTGGEAADQFSFCVALFEAVYGRRPFHARGAMELLYKLDTCELELPEQPRFTAPGWLHQLLVRGLSRHPEDRYPSMNALLAELTRDRAQRWRRVGVGVLALGLVASLTALAISPDAPAPARVDTPDLAGAWDGERRAELGEAFAKVDAPWAPGSEAAVVARLDHWGARWIAAAHASSSHADEAGELVRACLEGQRAQAELLVNTLTAGDPAVLEGAVAAIDVLPEPSRCAPGSASESSPSPAQLRTQLVVLADAAVQRSLGHFELAHTGADAVLEHAREAQLPSLELAALRQRGLANLEAGRQQQGFEDLLAARDLAIAHADLRSQAELSVDLAWRGRKLDNEALRRDRLHLARAHVDALIAASDTQSADRHALELRARMGLADALDALERGQLPEARELLDEGLALLAELDAKDTALALDYHHARANALRRAGELEAAEAAFVALIDHNARVRGSDHPRSGLAWYDAAGLAHQRGDMQLALDRMLRSRDIFRAALHIEHPDLADSELGLAAIHLSLEDEAAAKQHAELALASLERPGVQADTLPEALRLLGLLATKQEDWEQAASYYRRARELVEDDRLQRARIEHDLALTLAALDQHLQAAELFAVALPLLDEHLGDAGCRRLVRGYEQHANSALRLSQVEIARASFERALACTTSDTTRARLDASLAAL